ncbi:MAG: hypothetical protein AB7T49_05645 [Oligoflexales bacterium]
MINLTRLEVFVKVLTGLVFLFCPKTTFAGIHKAPIVIQGTNIRQVTRYPIANYRLFRTGPNGEAISIPFQIDEVDEWGDYILDQGPAPNSKASNAVFDLYDELSFMGDDVGPATPPKTWPGQKPKILFELKFQNVAKTDKPIGAVYIGVYFEKAPPMGSQKYVIYNHQAASITTGRYNYYFDKQNYLVLSKVEMVPVPPAPPTPIPIINLSTFFMKADLKYFITAIANHRSINSKLDAFKTGPVRTIVRVSFYYSFLKLNFEIGMYTEVSFFSNSVILPAIIYNPIDGPKSLNKGSGFYYGFQFINSPKKYDFSTNMIPYEEKKGLFDFAGEKRKPEKKYWLSMIGSDHMMFVELTPSAQMLKDNNIPSLYYKDVDGKALSHINNNDPHPLTESPDNIGLFFDMTKFKEGEHTMAFQLFFDNKKDLGEMENYKTLSQWMYHVSRL